MNDESDFGKIIQSKKTRDTNDQGPISKKAQKKKQKNINRSLAANRLLNEYESKVQEKKQMKVQPKAKKSDMSQEHQKKVLHLKSVSPNHKQSTILQQLKKHEFDLNDAMQALMNIPEDQQEISLMGEFQDEPKDKNDAKNEIADDPQQMAQKLMNQFYDQLGNDTIQMNSQEFTELFQEIAFIIKEDQEQKGMGLYQINDFVDNCFSIKDTLLEGLGQIHIDEDDPLLKQTQQFLEEIIKTKVVHEQKRQNDFPTLGSIQKPTKNNQRNYIQQIQQGYREQKSKQSFFTPSKVPTNIVHDFNTNYNSIYSIQQNPYAYADIQLLSKQYNGMSIDSLKFIYHQLHDLNTCKIFLAKYYPDKKYKIKIEEKKKIVKKIQSPQKIINQNAFRKKSVDADFKNMSLKQVRDQLDHLYKLKSLFKLTKAKTTNISYRKQLERLACKDDSRIRRLSEVARHKLFEEMAQSHPQYVDLHGYREEQIDETLDMIKQMVITEYKRGNSLLKTEKYSSNVFVIVKAMTGKGRHSNRYGKSVLKPAVKDWAYDQGYKALETQDSIDVYIQIM